MASTYSDLKIELIGTGEQAGTWGLTTNTNLGTAIEEAIVGRATANFASDADLTLTLTNTNATQVARHYILNVTSGVSLSTTRNLIVPTIDKPYIIENNTTGGQSIIVKTSGGSGVTVPNGKTVMVYADSTDVVAAQDHIPSLTLGSALPVASGGTGATTLTGVVKGNGTSAFTAGSVNLATEVTGTLPVASGGTGAITLTGVVKGNGTSAFTAGTVNLATEVTGTLPVANGGTGATSLTSNNVILGNGTSAVQFVAPGTAGNVLKSNGTTWTSAAEAAQVYPGAGIPNSTGSAWGTSYTTTGTGTVVALATSPSFTTPILGTPTSGTLTNCTGLPISTGVSGLGTNVATALGVNVGSSGAVVVNGGALGTPSSGTLTNATGLPLSTGVTGTLPVANGGTGATTLTSNNVILGNGTSAVQFVAPGANGNVLTSNGTTWTSAAPAAAVSLSANNAFTGANTFYNSTGQTFGTGTSTQDGIIIAGRAGGSSSYRVTLSPGTLSANRAITFPDAAGEIVLTSSTQTLTNKTISGASNTLTVDGTNGVGYINIPQNSQSAAYTLVAGDAGKHILHPSADTTARTFTIPANSSVPFPVGTAVTFINQNGAGVVTIAITTDTMRLAGAGTTGSRTLAANGIATAVKITSTEWIISGTGLT